MLVMRRLNKYVETLLLFSFEFSYKLNAKSNAKSNVRFLTLDLTGDLTLDLTGDLTLNNDIILHTNYFPPHSGGQVLLECLFQNQEQYPVHYTCIHVLSYDNIVSVE